MPMATQYAEPEPLDLLGLTRHLMTTFTCPACEHPVHAWVAERPRVIPIEQAGLDLIGVTLYPCLDHFRFQVATDPGSVQSMSITATSAAYLPADPATQS